MFKLKIFTIQMRLKRPIKLKVLTIYSRLWAYIRIWATIYHKRPSFLVTRGFFNLLDNQIIPEFILLLSFSVTCKFVVCDWVIT